MRVVFDLQSAQRGALEDLAFSLALISLFPPRSTFVVLDGSLPADASNLRKRLEAFLPSENIRTWHSPGQLPVNSDNHWRLDAHAAIRELLVTSLQPDAVVVPVEQSSAHLPMLMRFRSSSNYPVLLCVRSSGLSMDDDLQGLKGVDAIAVFGVPSEGVSRSKCFRSLKSLVQMRSNSEFVRDLGDLIEAFSAESMRPVPARLRLAFVTPVPPARSGISVYAVEMFFALSPHYDVTLIVETSLYRHVDQTLGLNVADDLWFVENHAEFDRIVYNFGNSPFHAYMDGLLDIAPGIVVMHEFFLADLFHYVDQRSGTSFLARLCGAHGFRPLVELSSGTDISQLVSKYPANATVVDRALGLIVHSDSAKSIATKWFGKRCATDWSVIPLPRATATEINKADARASLNMNLHEFVISSFGLITQNKQTDKLIEAWLASEAYSSGNSTLFLVGELSEGAFGARISEMIRKCSGPRVVLVGYVDLPMYSKYLAASDVAVQLRAGARGETSAAALDTMKCGVATIVNAHGSMADLPDDTVVKIPDNFVVQDLTEAIDRLFKDVERRRFVSEQAKVYVREVHSAERCAAELSRCIEKVYHRDLLDAASIAVTLSRLVPQRAYSTDYAEAIALTLTPRSRAPTLFLDVSAIVRSDLRTGIQRVVRAIVSEFLKQDYRLPIYPIYMSDAHNRWQYRYANKWALNEIAANTSVLEDQPVEFSAGDKLLIVDYTGPLLYSVDEQSDVYRRVKSAGVEISAIVYDLLPIKFPDLFPKDAAVHVDWLQALARLADRAICISNSVAQDVRLWYDQNLQSAAPSITHFHLGADLEKTSPSLGVSEKVASLLQQLRGSNVVLVVGTLEPRKRHSQILDAIEEVWRRGEECHLVFVGKLGWMSADLENRLDRHPERSKRFHWLFGVTDEELDKLYAVATCLIAASIDEGFGLPLIESAQHKVAIIARDIPVFREVAGPYATYFRGDTGSELAEVILDWFALYKKGLHQRSDDMPWLSWSDSAKQLFSILFDGLARAELNTPGKESISSSCLGPSVVTGSCATK